MFIKVTKYEENCDNLLSEIDVYINTDMIKSIEESRYLKNANEKVRAVKIEFIDKSKINVKETVEQIFKMINLPSVKA